MTQPDPPPAAGMAELAELRRERDELRAMVAELQIQLAGANSIPPGWVPLKVAAGTEGVSSEAIRRRCGRGTVKHTRVGGRLYIDPGSLTRRR
jgi:hypothetical protein